MIGMLIRNRLGIEVFGTNTRIEGHRSRRIRCRRFGDGSLWFPLLPHPTGIHPDRCQPTPERTPVRTGLMMP